MEHLLSFHLFTVCPTPVYSLPSAVSSRGRCSLAQGTPQETAAVPGVCQFLPEVHPGLQQPPSLVSPLLPSHLPGRLRRRLPSLALRGVSRLPPFSSNLTPPGSSSWRLMRLTRGGGRSCPSALLLMRRFTPALFSLAGWYLLSVLKINRDIKHLD